MFGERDVSAAMGGFTRQHPSDRVRFSKVLFCVVTSAVALLPACAYILGGTVDYVFAVSGAVTGADGHPIQGCEVTLEVGEPVYQAITPIRRQVRTTSAFGDYQFTYLTHRRDMPYRLQFRKEGYGVHSLIGTSPPSSVHNVTLQLLPAPGGSASNGG